MKYSSIVRATVFTWLVLLSVASANAGQEPQQPAPPAHDMAAMNSGSPWMFMYDGVLFATFSHQGGPRGGTEFISTDWLMGMATRRAGPGQLTLTGMVSLDRATTGPRGYLELFQVGESYKFIPLVDRQHPHDLLMQASVAWRIPLNETTGITFAAAPVGDPALGPIAFMHRPSAAENPAAPLGHHTFDSTHITMGVITASVDRGPWVFESSVFQSVEPDDNRWDLVDFGSLDSWSARVWFTPSAAWQFQASHGYLAYPERLEFMHVRRTTASASWFKPAGNGFTAATVMIGRNDKQLHGAFHAAVAEATRRQGRWSAYGRLEALEVETLLLQTRGLDHTHGIVPSDALAAGTLGGVLELPQWRRFELGVGTEATFYAVPETLRATHGARPVSFRLFLRVRPPAGPTGRMWNMRMGEARHH
jgi:hypothetical protein